MEVNFWSLSKRYNSTKVPLGEGNTVKFTYKGETDSHNPIIELSNWQHEWNYAKIDDIFFFVDKSEHISNSTYRLYLRIDLLATYKSDILNTKANVLYSASNYNINLIDTRFTTSGIFNVVSDDTDAYFTNEGTFVLTCAAQGSRHLGMSVTYFLTPQQMIDTAHEFNNPDFWDRLKIYFSNPFDSIISLGWLPIPINRIPNKTEVDLVIGTQTLSGNEPIKAYVVDTHERVSIPTTSHNFPIRWSVDDFRRLPPYTKMLVHLPGCGLNEVPVELLYNTQFLEIESRIDIFTGNVEYLVRNASLVISQYSGNVMVRIPIAQVQSRVGDFINFTAGVGSTAALFASGHPYAAITSGAYALANAAQPQITTQNGALQGSFLNGNAINTKISIWFVTNEVNDEPNQNWRDAVGGVCNKVLLLSTLSGYVKTDSVSVSARAYLSELEQINNLLNGGVFIE